MSKIPFSRNPIAILVCVTFHAGAVLAMESPDVPRTPVSCLINDGRNNEWVLPGVDISTNASDGVKGISLEGAKGSKGSGNLTLEGAAVMNLSGTGSLQGVVAQMDAGSGTLKFNKGLEVHLKEHAGPDDVFGVRLEGLGSSRISSVFSGGPVVLTQEGEVGGADPERSAMFYAESSKDGTVKVDIQNGLTIDSMINGIVLQADSNVNARRSVDVKINGETIIRTPKGDEEEGIKALLLGKGDTTNKIFGRLQINEDESSKVVLEGNVVAENGFQADIILNKPGSHAEGQWFLEPWARVNLRLDGEGVFLKGGVADMHLGAGYINTAGNDMKSYGMNLELTNHARWELMPIQTGRPGNFNYVTFLTVDDTSEIIFPDLQGQSVNDTLALGVMRLTGSGARFVMPYNEGELNGVPVIVSHEELTGSHRIDFDLSRMTDSSSLIGSLVGFSLNEESKGTFTTEEQEDGLFRQRVVLEKMKSPEYAEFMKGRDDAKARKWAGLSGLMWVITDVERSASADRPTPLVESIVSGRLAGHALWSGRLAEDTLMARLGDIRLNGAAKDGLWMRTRHSRAKLDDVYSFRMNTHHYELGYDRTDVHGDGRVLWGGSFNWDDGKADLRRGDAKVRSAGIALYRSQTFGNGWYFDAVARIDRQRDKLRSTDTHGEGYDGSVGRWGFSLSGEVGRTFEFTTGLFVQPEAQLTVGRLSGGHFTTSNDVTVDGDAVKALISRVGVKAGMGFGEGRGDVHVKADLLREWLGRDVVTMSTKGDSLEVSVRNRKTWGRVGLGANYRFDKAFTAHASLDYDVKGRWGDHAGVNIGVRYSF